MKKQESNLKRGLHAFWFACLVLPGRTVNNVLLTREEAMATSRFERSMKSKKNVVDFQLVEQLY